MKHSLIQQVDQPTHGIEILDLVFSNDQDLVSSVSVEAWPRFTDHRVITAQVSYQVGSDPAIKEKYLLECGRKLKKLNFNKANWDEIKHELSEVDWSDMEVAAKTSPRAALDIFMEELLPLLERHVPERKSKKKLAIEWIGKEEFSGEGWLRSEVESRQLPPSISLQSCCRTRWT